MVILHFLCVQSITSGNFLKFSMSRSVSPLTKMVSTICSAPVGTKVILLIFNCHGSGFWQLLRLSHFSLTKLQVVFRTMVLLTLPSFFSFLHKSSVGFWEWRIIKWDLQLQTSRKWLHTVSNLQLQQPVECNLGCNYFWGGGANLLTFIEFKLLTISRTYITFQIVRSFSFSWKTYF